MDDECEKNLAGLAMGKGDGPTSSLSRLARSIELGPPSPTEGRGVQTTANYMVSYSKQGKGRFQDTQRSPLTEWSWVDNDGRVLLVHLRWDELGEEGCENDVGVDPGVMRHGDERVVRIKLRGQLKVGETKGG